MQVTVRLRKEALQRNPGKLSLAAPQELLDLVGEFGAHVQPMHPGIQIPELASYFLIDVPDSRAEWLLRRLRETTNVEAAYAKPREELP